LRASPFINLKKDKRQKYKDKSIKTKGSIQYEKQS
jgi:hypothetical protein